MSAELPSSLVLLGAGKMGQAMLAGWLAQGLEPSRITAIDPHLDEAGRALLAKKGVRFTASPEGLPSPEALVLAIKPQTLDSAAPGACGLIGKDTLVLSILAGKRIADLASRLGVSGGIVRAMPNTPAAVARGISRGAGDDGPPAGHGGCASRVHWPGRMDRRRSAHRPGDRGLGLRPGLCVPSRRMPGAGRRQGRPAARTCHAACARDHRGRRRIAVSRPGNGGFDAASQRHLAWSTIASGLGLPNNFNSAK